MSEIKSAVVVMNTPYGPVRIETDDQLPEDVAFIAAPLYGANCRHCGNGAIMQIVATNAPGRSDICQICRTIQ